MDRAYCADTVKDGRFGRAIVRVGGTQRHFREDVVEIFQDDAGLDEDAAIMFEGRHHAIWIELDIPGLQIFALFQRRHDAAFPFQTLFGKADAHPLRAGRAPTVIKL